MPYQRFRKSFVDARLNRGGARTEQKPAGRFDGGKLHIKFRLTTDALARL